MTISWGSLLAAGPSLMIMTGRAGVILVDTILNVATCAEYLELKVVLLVLLARGMHSSVAA